MARPISLLACIAVSTAMACSDSDSAGPAPDALDQQQPIYDANLSARTLPGYTVWQSFTAGRSGILAEIDMGFYHDMSGSGELLILAGTGTAGAILDSVTVAVTAFTRPTVSWNAWTVHAPVTAGSSYTFIFRPNPATLPDPYGVALGHSDPYALGTMGTDDPTGSYPTTFDLVFRTYVQ